MFYKWLNSIAAYSQFNKLVDFTVWLINQVMPANLKSASELCVLLKSKFSLYIVKKDDTSIVYTINRAFYAMWHYDALILTYWFY